MALFEFGKKKKTPAPASAPAATPVSASTPKPDDDLTSEEQYTKGMELFKARDYDGAYELLRRVCRTIGAKKNAYPDGQAAMGWMYENGQGTEAKDSTAYLHYRIAAQNGNRDGMAGVVRLTAKKDVPSVDECQRALDYIKQLGTEEIKSLLSTVNRKLAEAQKSEELKELDLNEENVQAIFNRCLAGSGSKLNTSILFLRRYGFSEDSNPIYFDFDKITSNTLNIGYLLGQLDMFHQNSLTIIPALATKKYGGSSWTTDGRIVTQLMHLASVSGYLQDFRKKDSVIDAPVVSKIKPTLSPKDPAFPAWWEAHKAEWEQ